MPQPMAHVFIVDDTTFPVHLEYQFAGTTAGFKNMRNVSLYADIARIRPGHRAYFYLLGKGFFGPFKIDPGDQGVWWDSLDPTFLQDRLGLRLIYRVRVVADNVYPLGISEWDALDKYLRDPDRCLWSLVYRKLKGERGCTMIFPWEDSFLLERIHERNRLEDQSPLRCRANEHLTWDRDSGAIKVVPSAFPQYDPHNLEHIARPEDPLTKARLASGSETHVQAFLVQNYGRFPDSHTVFGPTENLAWVGNEVACGLGMQKIDLFAISEREGKKSFRIIELKKDPPDTRTVWQLTRYIEWTTRFVPGADYTNIQPILLCRNLKRLPLPANVRDSFRAFNTAKLALPVKYIECTKDEDSDSLRFCEPDYGAE